MPVLVGCGSSNAPINNMRTQSHPIVLRCLGKPGAAQSLKRKPCLVCTLQNCETDAQVTCLSHVLGTARQAGCAEHPSFQLLPSPSPYTRADSGVIAAARCSTRHISDPKAVSSMAEFHVCHLLVDGTFCDSGTANTFTNTATPTS